MADEDEEEGKPDAGVPGWVVTFSDLMSLLLAFFVLLFSFSEMDKAEFKQVGGSLKAAFGVQRDIVIKDPLKGIQFLPVEFSPGRPDPTKLNEVRQETTATWLRYLLARDTEVETDFEKYRKNAKSLIESITGDLEAEGDQDEAKGGPTIHEKHRAVDVLKGFVAEGEDIAERDSSRTTAVSDLIARLLQEAVEKKESESGKKAANAREVMEGFKEWIAKEKEKQKKVKELIEEMIEKLGNQEEKGMVRVRGDLRKKIITITVDEKTSFRPGRAALNADFTTALEKMGMVLNVMDGDITVAGHTDNIPLKSPRYRNNWELSGARAASVVDVLQKRSFIRKDRFSIEAFGDTEPIESNDTPEGRAKNRRVEIKVKIKFPDEEKKLDYATQSVDRMNRMEELAEQVLYSRGKFTADDEELKYLKK